VSDAAKQFRVRYVKIGDAAVRDELLQGSDEVSLRAHLEQSGQTVLSVRLQKDSAPMTWPWGRKSVLSRESYGLFCREVRTLLRAGMTVVEAVDTLSAREQMDQQRGFLTRAPHLRGSLSVMLLERLQKGLSLSTALSELPQTPPVLVAAVRAGERTSNLAEALDDYLRFDTLIAALRKKIVSAAIYPALVTTVGLVISGFLLLVVMPNFANMYESVRTAGTGGMSGGAAFTVEVTHFIGKNRALVVTFILALAATLTLWIGSGKAKESCSRLARKVPWIKARIDDFQLAMMYQALALLIKGGYAMTEAMQVAANSALSASLKREIMQVRTRIEQGGSVSQALAQAKLCDEVGRRLMGAAERNGEFYLAADVVSRMHGERFELFVERVTRIVEPLLLLAVALLVGGIVILMYMPVFDMATQLL
jgi:general secretion pathway protein F